MNVTHAKRVAQQCSIQVSEPTFNSVYFAIVGVHTCTYKDDYFSMRLLYII